MEYSMENSIVDGEEIKPSIETEIFAWNKQKYVKSNIRMNYNEDDALAEALSDMYDRIGINGLVNVEDAKGNRLAVISRHDMVVGKQRPTMKAFRESGRRKLIFRYSSVDMNARDFIKKQQIIAEALKTENPLESFYAVAKG